MTAIVGSDTFTATCVGPDPGTATHTQVNDLGVGLANRTIWLKDRLVEATQLIEHARVNSSTLAPLTDLKASTTYLDIAPVTITLANSILAGDLVIVECMCHVNLECTTSPTNRVDMALALETVPVAFAHLSSESASFLPCRIRLAYVAVGTTTTPTFQLQGKCSTAVDLAQAEVYGPYDMTVTHLRPVAAP